jgi:hypothetical protein
MTSEPTQHWNVFTQIVADHWAEFKQFRPRYAQPDYDDLVNKMLGCGDPEQMGYIDYRCQPCGQGNHLVSMSCKSSLCLRCGKVYVDNWVSQVSKMLHEGVIYRHMVLTVPDVLRTTFSQCSPDLLSPFMPCGVRCVDDFFRTVSGRVLKGGYIVVIRRMAAMANTIRICTSSPAVGDGISRPMSGCIEATCPIRCCT